MRVRALVQLNRLDIPSLYMLDLAFHVFFFFLSSTLIPHQPSHCLNYLSDAVIGLVLILLRIF